MPVHRGASPIGDDFDVIVVGSGSSGGALAARLSENADRSVLLLEAGPVYARPDLMPPTVQDPSDMRNALPGAAYNWNLFADLTDDFHAPVARGRGMGGSSSINGAYFVRGTPSDFDGWARMGNDEWSYEKVLPFFKRSESDRDFPTSGAHGADGPIPVRREPADRAPEFSGAFTEACQEHGFPLERDKNGAGTGGVGPVPMNIENGRRVGTAIGYLMPALARSNFHLVGNAMVHRLVFEGTHCVGVKVDLDGVETTLRSREVVVSAGALRTPQLLMLSGIGPEAELRKHGVAVVAASPGVGQNLMDHPELSVPWTFKGKHPAMPGRGVLSSALNWTAAGSDQEGDMELLPFVATPASMMHLGSMAGRPVATLRMMRKTSPRLVVSQARRARVPFLIISVMQEDSRGTITLASTNMSDSPLIRCNLFSAESDRQRFRQGIEVALDLYESDAMRGIGAKLVGLSRKHLASQSSLDAWMAAHIFAVGHSSCSCRMGPANDPEAVVDQYGKVYGVEGLRLCDQSIFPKIPSRGPNATAMVTGERMSEFFS